MKKLWKLQNISGYDFEDLNFCTNEHYYPYLTYVQIPNTFYFLLFATIIDKSGRWTEQNQIFLIDFAPNQHYRIANVFKTPWITVNHIAIIDSITYLIQGQNIDRKIELLISKINNIYLNPKVRLVKKIFICTRVNGAMGYGDAEIIRQIIQLGQPENILVVVANRCIDSFPGQFPFSSARLYFVNIFQGIIKTCFDFSDLTQYCPFFCPVNNSKILFCILYNEREYGKPDSNIRLYQCNTNFALAGLHEINDAIFENHHIIKLTTFNSENDYHVYFFIENKDKNTNLYIFDCLQKQIIFNVDFPYRFYQGCMKDSFLFNGYLRRHQNSEGIVFIDYTHKPYFLSLKTKEVAKLSKRRHQTLLKINKSRQMQSMIGVNYLLLRGLNNGKNSKQRKKFIISSNLVIVWPTSETKIVEYQTEENKIISAKKLFYINNSQDSVCV